MRRREGGRDIIPFSRGGRRPPHRGRVVGAALIAAALFVAPGLDAASLVWRQSEGCRVWMVVDGDTVRAWCPGSGSQAVRLTGFDTPEVSGHCLQERAMALAATYRLRAALWTARRTDLPPGARRDRYDRMLAPLRIDGVGASHLLIGAGLARPYSGGRRGGWCSV